ARRLRPRRKIHRLLRARHSGEPRLAPGAGGAGVRGGGMKAGGYVTGLAIFSAGCAFGDAYEVPTPDPGAAPRDPVPPLVHQTLPPSSQLMTEWELPTTNPWYRYFKFTLLSALDNRPVEADLPDVSQLWSVQRAECEAARVASAPLPAGTLFIA